MKFQPTIILGTLICLVLVGYYGYLIYRGLSVPGPSKAPVVDSQLSLAIFDDPAFGEIRVKNINGPLPIVLNPEADLGNSNPF